MRQFHNNMDHWFNSGYKGQKRGFSCDEVYRQKRIWPFPPKTIYRFRLILVRPLTYRNDEGFWQPNRTFFTDKGSVPLFVQPFIPSDRFIGFYFHDSGYKHGYLHFSENGLDFKPRKMTRKQLDNLLFEQAWNDPVPGRASAGFTWCGVRTGGWFSFRSKYSIMLNEKGKHDYGD